MKALAVTAGIVFWTLVLGTAWLAFFPGSQSGEPVAILQIEPASDAAAPPGDSADTSGPEATEPSDATEGAPAADAEPATPAAPSGQTAKRGMDLPPGFAVTGPSGPGQAPVAEPGPGTVLPLDAPTTPPVAPE